MRSGERGPSDVIPGGRNASKFGKSPMTAHGGEAGRVGLPYLSYRRYLRARFGRPVLTIPLNAGFSCPNRDGTKSSQGCFFCDNRGFSPVAGSVEPVLDQLTIAITRARMRFDAFIAYLQPYSNTYASVEHLRRVYEPIVAVSGVVGLALGTRPDCLSEEVGDYLGEVARRTYVSVELGLQSSHDDTLRRINRGHSRRDFVECVNALARRGIDTVAHIILGLPGESPEMMMETARFLAGLPVDGVKIHQLMIFGGTEFERLFRLGEVHVLSLDEFARLAAEFLANLRPDQHIHRLVADSRPEHGLIAPEWSADKNAALRRITAFMDGAGVRQGSLARLLQFENARC